MKQKILIYGFLIFLLGSSSECKNQSPIDFGKSIFDAYRANELDLKKFLITRSEAQTLINQADQKATPEKEAYYLNYLIENQEEIIALANHDRQILFNDFNWKRSNIDSITYDYIYPKPGPDSLIKWPASQKNKIPESFTKIVFSHINIYAGDEKSKIIMTIDGAPFINGKWVLMEGKPNIERQ